jgi:hypothetical protein
MGKITKYGSIFRTVFYEPIHMHIYGFIYLFPSTGHIMPSLRRVPNFPHFAYPVSLKGHAEREGCVVYLGQGVVIISG